MSRLVEFTGGGVTVSVAVICLAAIGLVFGAIRVFGIIVKNKAVPKSQKTELIVCIISAVLIACFIGGITGYYFGILKLL